jgi:hypothetical protein
MGSTASVDYGALGEGVSFTSPNESGCAEAFDRFK